MSSILHEDTFHGTKKGMRRKTARRAFIKKSRISRSLALIRKSLDKLKSSGQIPMEDYMLLRTCLSHYKEFMPVDKRYKI